MRWSINKHRERTLQRKRKRLREARGGSLWKWHRGKSPERTGDSLKRQIPTVGSRRREDKQQRESFPGSYGREQKLNKKRLESSWVFRQERGGGRNMLFSAPCGCEEADEERKAACGVQLGWSGEICVSVWWAHVPNKRISSVSNPGLHLDVHAWIVHVPH